MARPKRKTFYAQIVSEDILENNSWIIECNNNSRIVIEYLVSSEAKTTAYYEALKATPHKARLRTLCGVTLK